MSLHELCRESRPYWENTVYSIYRANKNGVATSIFHIQIPFTPDKEAELMVRYGVAAEQRKAFYAKLLSSIQHEIGIANYLYGKGVASILRVVNTETASEDGTSYLYMETEYVEPALQMVQGGEIPTIEFLDMVSRVAAILRDMNAVGVSHRGVDLNEVYLNSEKRYLLSGFYYSSCDDMSVPHYDCYLPTRAANIAPKLLKGDRGSIGLDIQSLCRAAWNVFSGISYDYPMQPGRKLYPAYAPESVVEALEMGLGGVDEQCNAFRRKLAECRKEAVRHKEETGEDQTIPIRTLRYRGYQITYVAP